MPRYDLESDGSRLRFEARSSLHGISVETDELRGFLVLGDEPGAGPRGELVVPIAELRSGNPLVDRETRRRLDTRRHPELRAVVDELTPLGGDRYRAVGDVTVTGTTVEVAGELEIVRVDDGLRVRGSRTFDVRDWGIEPPSLLALRVHPDVTVDLDARAVPATGAPRRRRRDGDDGRGP